MIKKHWKKALIIITLIILSTSIGTIYAATVLNATEVTYNKDGNTIMVNTALDELYAKARQPKVGDVVNYNANRSNAAGNTYATGTYTYTTNTSNTGANDYTGGTTSSTFKSEDAMVWKILDINNETGAIKLLAANGTPSELQLKGRAGYAYYENILNNISEVYGHGYGATGARSVTVEDINNITGYNPIANSNGIHTQSFTGGIYFVDLTYTNGKVTSFTTKAASTSSPYTVTADRYYSYAGTSTGLANTTNTYKMIFQNTSGSNRHYWVASRCVNFYSTGCNFFMRTVGNGNVDGNSLIQSYYDYELDKSWPVCPVVSLDANVQLAWDESNSRWDLN